MAEWIDWGCFNKVMYSNFKTGRCHIQECKCMNGEGYDSTFSLTVALNFKLKYFINILVIAILLVCLLQILQIELTNIFCTISCKVAIIA